LVLFDARDVNDAYYNYDGYDDEKVRVSAGPVLDFDFNRLISLDRAHFDVQGGFCRRRILLEKFNISQF
jgi:hypothetical protein